MINAFPNFLIVNVPFINSTCFFLFLLSFSAFPTYAHALQVTKQTLLTPLTLTFVTPFITPYFSFSNHSFVPDIKLEHIGFSFFFNGFGTVKTGQQLFGLMRINSMNGIISEDRLKSEDGIKSQNAIRSQNGIKSQNGIRSQTGMGRFLEFHFYFERMIVYVTLEAFPPNSVTFKKPVCQSCKCVVPKRIHMNPIPSIIEQILWTVCFGRADT